MERPEFIPQVQALIDGRWLYFTAISHGMKSTGETKYLFSEKKEGGVQPMFTWSSESIAVLLSKFGFVTRLTEEGE
jgi:hypothetical protein